MNESEYLQGVHVTRLQAAARMAGLRWKNGDPGTDKAGIIARLLQHPSILRATVATLQRMEKGEPIPTRKPVTFNDDDFTDDDAPISTPVTEQSATEKPSQIDAAMLRDYVKRIDWHDRNRTTEQNITDVAKRVNSLADAIEGMAEEIESLKTRAPIEFHFPDRPVITIDPTDHHEAFPTLVKYLQINRRVILCGAAGTGKSMACKNAAQALGVPFYVLPPVTMSHELIGHRDAQGVFHETPLTRAYKNGGLCLLDESDASLPDALLVANPILDGNGFAMLGDGEMHAQHPDFLAVFNMNTDGNGATMQYSGRNRLDGATLARFGVRIDWQIDARIERVMSGGQTDWHRAIVAIRDFMVAREIVDVNATPRHLKTGAALLNAGCAKAEVLADCLKSGALGAVWSDVLRLPAVSTFLRS